MTADVAIRLARGDEYESTGDLAVRAYGTLEDAGDPAYDRQLRDVASRVQGGEVLVAEVDGRVIGTVTFVPPGAALAEVDDPDAATIRMLGVDPSARGRGVGELLVRACIDRAVRAGARRVRLDTRTSMTGAQCLYERLGFVRDPTHDRSPIPGIHLLAYVHELGTPDAA
jgi:ribosomal protein S18 acetylase RimI-like enzyme